MSIVCWAIAQLANFFNLIVEVVVWFFKEGYWWKAIIIGAVICFVYSLFPNQVF